MVMRRVALLLAFMILVLSVNTAQSLKQTINIIPNYGRVVSAAEEIVASAIEELQWGTVVSGTAWGDIDPKWGWGDFFSYAQIDLLKKSGATALRIMLDKRAWDIGSAFNPLEIPYRDYLQHLVLYCRTNGLYVLLDLTRDSSMGEFHAAEKQLVIETPELRTAWINWGKAVVGYCKPDAIGLMNEPAGVEFDYWYDNFVTPSIKAYSSVDPNINIFVMGMPFHDLSGFARRPINNDKVFYEYHFYYKYPISLSETSQSYYDTVNNYATGNLVTAKTQLFKYLNDFKFAALPKNRINIAECGVFGMAGGQTTPSNPNWKVFMQDLYDYTRQNQLNGLFQYSVGNWHYLMLDPKTNYKTLTPYGEFWAQNSPV